jgi:hypothetical protein
VVAERVKNRIADLVGEARGLVRRKLAGGAAYRCQGKPFDEVVALVEAALPPGGADVLSAIAEQIQLVESQDPTTLPNGEKREPTHGFVEWIWQLQDGNATLPEVIPLTVLTAWRDGFSDMGTTERIRSAVGSMERVAGHCPDPNTRCASCKLLVWCCEKESKKKPEYTAPVPHWRCSDCLMVLPHTPPENFGECPVCGSSKLSPRDLSQPGCVFPMWPAQFVGQTIFHHTRG